LRGQAAGLAQASQPRVALAVHQLSKSFGATRALSDVDLELGPGELVALLGPNGAGKSTLIKTLAGVHRPTRGTIEIGTRSFHDGLSAAQAREAGLAFVHQDLGLVERMTVAENIAHVAGFQKRGPLISWRRQRRFAKEILERWNLDVDEDVVVITLDSAARALVAIARALATDARVIVFDEPTSALPSHDVEVLFAAIKRLHAGGVAILYVTHRLDEVSRVADRVVVLRDGERVAEFDARRARHDELVEAIIGSRLASVEVDRGSPSPENMLQLFYVSGYFFGGISLRLKRGEVLGLVGRVGAGHRNVGEVIAGVAPQFSGVMRLGGRLFRPESPVDAISRGIAYLPGKRSEAGFPTYDSSTNLFTRAGRYGWRVSPRRERSAAAGILADWRVRPSEPTVKFGKLSGGNQQKLLAAKWMDQRPLVLIADEPTAGVDVGSRDVIYTAIADSAREGTSVLLISSDAEEVARLAHRALVFKDGRIACELDGDEVTVERVVAESSRT
jgi:ribose transport system ATP-binding protein